VSDRECLCRVASTLSKRIYGIGTLSPFEPSAARETKVFNCCAYFSSADRPASILCVEDQKRLELARSLATRPKLLLCDEICGGLTESEMNLVLGLIRRIRDRGTTVLYVEHNLKAIMSVCDHVVVLNSGQKLAEGTPRVTQNDASVIEAYIGTSAVA
jgi:branched-chain amino acid transport system ATP-binding protein